MAWAAAAGAPLAVAQTDAIENGPNCSGVNASVLAAVVGAGTHLPMTFNAPGVIANYYGIKICPIPNDSVYCTTNAWIVQYPTHASVTPDPVVPACTPPGRYRAIAAVGATQTAFQCGDSNPFTITVHTPCITGVIAETPAATGNRTTIRWTTENQTRFAIDLENGTSTWTIVGWTNSSARTFAWDIPSSLTPGTYWVRVKVDNGIAQGSATTDSFFIQGGPTVSNVTVSVPGSCFSTVPVSTYAGKRVRVSWTSTYQASWALPTHHERLLAGSIRERRGSIHGLDPAGRIDG